MHLLVFCTRLAVMPSILVSVLDIYWAVWAPVSSIAAPTAMPTARSTAMPIASSYLDFIFYFRIFQKIFTALRGRPLDTGKGVVCTVTVCRVPCAQ
jgi:hypothetical protein